MAATNALIQLAPQSPKPCEVVMRYLFLLSVISFAAWLATVHAATPRVLTAQEVRSLLQGSTLEGESQLARFRDVANRRFQLHLHADGSLEIVNFQGETDTGVWEVNEAGQFCNQYQHTRRGMRRCYQVEQYPDHYALRDVGSGEISTLFTVKNNAQVESGGEPLQIESADKPAATLYYYDEPGAGEGCF